MNSPIASPSSRRLPRRCAALLEIRALPIALVDIERAAFDRGDEPMRASTARRGKDARQSSHGDRTIGGRIHAAVARLAGTIVSAERRGRLSTWPAAEPDRAFQAVRSVTSARSPTSSPRSSNAERDSSFFERIRHYCRFTRDHCVLFARLVLQKSMPDETHDNRVITLS